jgi:hypothetical protein
VRHDRHRHALVAARESPHVAHVGHAPDVVEIGVGDVLRSL